MPKPKIAKTTIKVPRYDQPYVVDMGDLEGYTKITEQPPYTYLQRILPQYVCCLLLEKLHKEGKRLVTIYLPAACIPQSYQNNPPAFATIIRRQRNNVFQYVTARFETATGRYRINASHNVPQKRNSYLGVATTLMLAEWQRLQDAADPTQGATLIYPYTDMPIAYQNDQYVFRNRLMNNLRKHSGDPALQIVLKLVENGYRVSLVPKNN